MNWTELTSTGTNYSEYVVLSASAGAYGGSNTPSRKELVWFRLSTSLTSNRPGIPPSLIAGECRPIINNTEASKEKVLSNHYRTSSSRGPHGCTYRCCFSTGLPVTYYLLTTHLYSFQSVKRYRKVRQFVCSTEPGVKYWTFSTVLLWRLVPRNKCLDPRVYLRL